MKLFLNLLLLLSASCGYHYKEQAEQVSLSIPFVKGDVDGRLTNEIVHALSSSGQFTYQAEDGSLILHVEVLADSDERIGYRYDRKTTKEDKRRKNIVGTENRETINIRVKLINAATQEVLFGPRMISASAEYDYIDSNSIRDLVFSNPDGKDATVINFSLGQLDSIEGAHDDAQAPIFRKLAQKLVDELRDF
jgi:hypothetical protein